MQIFNINKKKEHLPVMVFKNKSKAGKDYYTMGLSHKVGEKYENGYIPCVFNKDAQIENKDRIILREASLEFYKNETETKYYIRVYKYDKLEEKNESNDSLPF